MTTDHKTNCAAIGGQCDGGQNCARQGFFAFLCSGDDCQWRRLNHFCTRRWYNLLSRRPLWWTLWLTALSAARQERRSVVRWDFKTELWAGRTFCFSLPVWKSDVFTSQVMKKGIWNVTRVRWWRTLTFSWKEKERKAESLYWTVKSEWSRLQYALNIYIFYSSVVFTVCLISQSSMQVRFHKPGFIMTLMNTYQNVA